MKKMVINKAYSFEEADAFDRKFWRKSGVTARFAAAWNMVITFIQIKGHGRKLRLRRSIQNIKHV